MSLSPAKSAALSTFWSTGPSGLARLWGSVTALTLLSGSLLPQDAGWRYAFGIGGALGLLVLLLRLAVPESPRWLMLRGYEEEAEKTVCGIEERVRASSGKELPPPEGEKLKITPRDHTPLGEIFANMWGENRKRSILGIALMIAQSFFFNAVFFTYALVGKKFFQVPDQKLPLQLLPFAIASFLGPFVLGPLFDKVGRKPMICATYGYCRSPARRHLRSVRHRLSWTSRSRYLLQRHLLRRLFRGQRRLSDGLRDLPARDTCLCDRHLLCHRHAYGGRWRAFPLWIAHPNRLQAHARDWLCHRSCAHAWRRSSRGCHWR